MVEAVQLGDKVKHEDGTKGEVVEMGYCGIKIKWSDATHSVRLLTDPAVTGWVRNAQ